MITLRLVSEKRSPISFIIRRVTYSPFSHAEFKLPDGTYLGSLMKGGVQIRPADYAKYDVEALFVADVTPEVETKIYEFIHKQIGKPYDKLGIINLALQHKDNNTGSWKDDTAWFCSELIAAAFEYAGYPLLIVPDADHVTPRDLTTSVRLRQIK
jgi:uncharacterized protein YycO